MRWFEHGIGTVNMRESSHNHCACSSLACVVEGSIVLQDAGKALPRLPPNPRPSM